MFALHPKLGKIGLALSGGALKGSAHLAVCEALFDAGIFPHEISGASVGSLVGAAYAGVVDESEFRIGLRHTKSIFDELEKNPALLFPPLLPKKILSISEFALWRKRTWKEISLWKSFGILSNNRLYRLIEKLDPIRMINKNGVRFSVAVFMHSGGASKHITIANYGNHDVRLDRAIQENPSTFIDVIVGSASRLPIFQSMEVFDMTLSDGDCLQLLPLIESGCDTIFVSCCYRDPRDDRGDVTRGDDNDIFGWFARRLARKLPFALDFMGHYTDHYQETGDNEAIDSAKRIAAMLSPIRRIRIIVIYAETSETHKSYSARPGDFAKTHIATKEKADDAIRSILEAPDSEIFIQ